MNAINKVFCSIGFLFSIIVFGLLPYVNYISKISCISEDDAKYAIDVTNDTLGYPFSNLSVGDTYDLSIVTYLKGDGYRIGFIDNSGSLITFEVNSRSDNINVIFIEGISTKYIKRIDNTIKNTLFRDSYIAHKSKFEVYVPISELNSGIYEINCGKNCTETITPIDL